MPPETTPETVGEQATQRFYQTNPGEKRIEEVGFAALTPAEKKIYTYTKLIRPIADRKIPLSTKAEREYWKQVTMDGLPIRRLRNDYAWGTDKNGTDIGSYKLEDFSKRTGKQVQLSSLSIRHQSFLARRETALAQGTDLPAQEIEDERQRRKEMADLRKDLYGEITGALANDPDWDDVLPIPHKEPDDALARIAYPDDYAEGEQCS